MSSWAEALNTPVQPVPLDAPKVYDLPKFDGYQDPKKLDVLMRLAEQAGRDPRLATLAVDIFRQAGVQPRDYIGQASALLKWVQTNIYYVNEPDERLQEPTYTLRVRYGDCDDCAILLYALCRSVRLPCKFVISGVDGSGRKRRYHQGDRHFPRDVNWSHIYTAIGDKPYGPAKFRYAEPTMRVPLGWDVVGASGPTIPEMAAYGDPAAANAVDTSLAKTGSATALVGSGGWNWKEAGATIVIAALSTVAGDIALRWYRAWANKRSK
jgi:transglutaminase-like putative cysteine protease